MARKFTKNLKANSAEILNQIRNNASQAYADSVDICDGDNIRTVGQQIMSDTGYTNEFLMGLLNRIGTVIMQSKTWNNPLKVFKRGLLEFGEVAEEIFVNEVEEREYDMYEAQDRVFKVAIPDVRACFYPLNSRKQYKATINETMLQQAFLSREGVVDLINKIMERISLQDNDFEFRTMKNIFRDCYTKGMFYPVIVDNPLESADNTKALVRKMRAIYSKLKFVSTDYNFVGVKTFTSAEDIHIFIDADLEAKLDVDVLASAFNMNKTEFLGKLTVLDSLPIPNAYAIVCDKEFFRVWDNKIASGNTYNSEGLYNNYVFHHWETFGHSPFANAIIFTNDESAITSITLDNTTITANPLDTVVINATVEATGMAQKGVVFEVVSGQEYIAEITSNGKQCNIRFKTNITAGAVEIRAVCKYDTTKTATANITITAE